MTELSDVSTLAADTDIYHHSRALPDLVALGSFDPQFSHNDGAFYFTTERVQRTNCIATVQEPLKLFSLSTISDEEFEMLTDVGDGNFWLGAVSLGFDGRLFVTREVFTEITPDRYSDELVIFKESLHKLADIRSLKDLL
ncbi:MAG TPA: hypothetical protein VG992_00310 [Candidatus Saccharimonadales bacterium]|nr:hypothetical protein [Candidatus Saccharimonadales bacterium]